MLFCLPIFICIFYSLLKKLNMPKFHIDCLLEYSVFQATEFIFHVEAAQHEWQQILAEHVSITPSQLKIENFEHGETCNRLIRISAAENSRVRLHYTSHIKTDIPQSPLGAQENDIAQIPAANLRYLAASHFCESDLLINFANRIFGNLPTGYQRVQAICDWIYANVIYESGSSNNTTSAKDILINRAGVCRDFAHLGITFCRALNIPARYVFGYMPFYNALPDFHAIFEVYLGQQWILFDATRMGPLDEFVRVGTGLDAKDVPFASLFGAAELIKIKPKITKL